MLNVFDFDTLNFAIGFFVGCVCSLCLLLLKLKTPSLALDLAREKIWHSTGMIAEKENRIRYLEALTKKLLIKSGVVEVEPSPEQKIEQQKQQEEEAKRDEILKNGGEIYGD